MTAPPPQQLPRRLYFEELHLTDDYFRPDDIAGGPGGAAGAAGAGDAAARAGVGGRLRAAALGAVGVEDEVAAAGELE